MNMMLRGWDNLLRVMRWLSQAVLAFMMLTICYDAMMRYLFNAPTSWSLEINSFLLVYLAIMSAAEIQRKQEHIRITFFVDRLPATAQALIAIITGVLGMLFSLILAWRGSLMMLQAWEYGERVSSVFGTPMVYPYALIPIGFGALAIQFLIEALLATHRLWRPDRHQESSHA